MEQPRVTIGIATYNAQETIVRAIQSALSQDWPNFEIVIVDDASNDHTLDIVREHQSHYPDKIRFYHQEDNAGVAVTRNRIIEEARGDFLVFFDDDDSSLPSRVSAQVIAILKYEENLSHEVPIICHTARTQIFPDGNQSLASTLGCLGNEPAPSGLDVARAILFNTSVRGGNGAMATCSQAARTSVYRSLSGFDPLFRRSEDTEFCLRLALAGGHFLGLPVPYVTQYMILTSDKPIGSERKYGVQLLKKYQGFIEQEGRGNFDVVWLNLKYDYLERRRGAFFLNLGKVFLRHPILSARKMTRAIPNWELNHRIRSFHAVRRHG